jgi:hypothetical protein
VEYKKQTERERDDYKISMEEIAEKFGIKDPVHVYLYDNHHIGLVTKWRENDA